MAAQPSSTTQTDSIGPKAIDSLTKGVIAGHPAMLGRAISLVEAGQSAGHALLANLPTTDSNTVVAGITGPPGAGKSTLIDCCIRHWRADGKTVAVIAIDPSSPLSGGSLLGDRTRMGRHSGDAGVFIRSLASRGHLGGLSVAVDDIVQLMRATPFDVVVLETVGAGQSETEVAEVADVCLVLAAPGQGDDIQAIKAGILEIADILVVNKADLSGADALKRQLLAMLKLRSIGHLDVPVLTTAASLDQGADKLIRLISEIHGAVSTEERERRAFKRLRKRVEGAAADRVSNLIANLPDEAFEVSGQRMDILNLADRLLKRVLQKQP